MITTTAAQAGGPRAAQLDRATAMRLAAEEYDRFLAVLAGLADADWAKPTDCPGWDVRALATHVLGNRLGTLTERSPRRRYGKVFIGAAAAARGPGGHPGEPCQHLGRAKAEPAGDLNAGEGVGEHAAVPPGGPGSRWPGGRGCTGRGWAGT